MADEHPAEDRPVTSRPGLSQIRQDFENRARQLGLRDPVEQDPPGFSRPGLSRLVQDLKLEARRLGRTPPTLRNSYPPSAAALKPIFEKWEAQRKAMEGASETSQDSPADETPFSIFEKKVRFYESPTETESASISDAESEDVEFEPPSHPYTVLAPQPDPHSRFPEGSYHIGDLEEAAYIWPYTNEELKLVIRDIARRMRAFETREEVYENDPGLGDDQMDWTVETARHQVYKDVLRRRTQALVDGEATSDLDRKRAWELMRDLNAIA